MFERIRNPKIYLRMAVTEILSLKTSIRKHPPISCPLFDLLTKPDLLADFWP